MATLSKDLLNDSLTHETVTTVETRSMLISCQREFVGRLHHHNRSVLVDDKVQSRSSVEDAANSSGPMAFLDVPLTTGDLYPVRI